MTNETLIKVESLRADGKNGQFATERGVVQFDADGIASVPINVAASLYSHPDFAIPDPEDEKTVKGHIDEKRDSPEGFEPGEEVRARCREMAGAKGSACTIGENGEEVIVEADFGIDGYAIMGVNTAKAFKKSLGDAFTYELIEKAKEVNSAKSKPKDADKKPEEVKDVPLTKAQQAAADKKAKAAAKKAEKEAADKESEQTAPVVDTEIPTSINVENQ